MGLTDFSKTQLFDRNWWIRLRLMLDELESSEIVDLLKMDFDRYKTMLGASLTKDGFKKVWSRLDDVKSRVGSIKVPWLIKHIEDKEKDEMSSVSKKLNKVLNKLGKTAEEREHILKITADSLSRGMKR